MRKCSVKKCDSPCVGRGLCSKHYKRFMKYGSTDLPKRTTACDKKCSVDGCNNIVGKHGSHGMCSSHARAAREKALGFKYNDRVSAICSVDGCGDKAISNSTHYCSAHYRQMRIYGRIIKKNKVKPANRQNHELYTVWLAMKDRCRNQNNPHYKNYGGRGIKVCDRWSQDFLNFLDDMGERPGPGYSIDRIDNDGDYCPGNCKWATRHEQNINRRGNSPHPCVFSRQRGTRVQWVARIKKDGKAHTRVRRTLEEAIIARDELAREMGVA